MARTFIASGIGQGLLAAARVSPLALVKPASNEAPFFSFKNTADDPSVVDIYVIDFIGDWIDDYWGFGVTAKSFIDQLSKLSADVKTIRVHINSPGGDVFSALNIANALRDQQQTKGRVVETIVEGLAASAASIILMAGSKVTVSDNGVVMVHEPFNPRTWGTATDLRSDADVLDTLTKTIIATYKWQSKLSDEQLQALVSATTWMGADEAIANGFATHKIEGLRAVASIAPQAVNIAQVPEQYRARVQAFLKPTHAAMSPADVLRVCREGGCLEIAENLLTSQATSEQVTAAVTTARETKAAAETRASEARAAEETRVTAIRAMCKTAKFEDIADVCVSSGLTVEATRAAVTSLQAKVTAAQIDGTLPPNASATSGAPVIDHQAIYARMNAQ